MSTKPTLYPIHVEGVTPDPRIARAHATSRSKGFWDDGVDPKCIPEKLCLIHSEVSEALEAYRDGVDPSEIYTIDGRTESKAEGIAAELADAVIRIWDLCGALDIPLDAAIEVKMAYNERRSHKNGGKVC